MKKPTLSLSSLLVGVATVIVAITAYNFARARITAIFGAAAINSKGAQLNSKPGTILSTGQPRKPTKSEPPKTDEKQIEEKLKRHEERLEAIEEEFAEKRQEIEERYLCEFSKLEFWSKRVLTQLESEEKTACAEFNQKVKHTMSQISGYKATYGYTRSHGYVTPDGYIASHGSIESVGHSSATEENFVAGNPSGEFAARIRSIANAKTKTLKDLEWYFERLQNQRAWELAKLEKANDLQKANVLSVIRFLTAKPTHGLVTGILYNDENASVIIDTQILKAGNTIHGVKIIKILRNKVEFEKNGQRWMQKTGETPGPEWQ